MICDFTQLLNNEQFRESSLTILPKHSALAAADNAVMLLDAAKGLEPQTRKLFEVVRMRALPLCKLSNRMFYFS